MFSGAVGQIYCRHPLGLTPVRQGGAPVSASRTIVAVAVHTSCSTQNACEFVLVSRAQSHHANTLVGLLALTRFFTSVRLSDPGLGSHGPLGPTATLAVLPGPLASSSQLFARVLLRRFLVDPLDALALLKHTFAALRDTCRFVPLHARGGQSLVVRTGLPPSSISAQSSLGASHHLHLRHPCLVLAGPLVHKTQHLHECRSSRESRIVHLFRMVSLSASPRRCRSLRSQRRRHSNTLSVTRSVKPATSTMTSTCKSWRFTPRPTASRKARRSRRCSSPGAS